MTPKSNAKSAKTPPRAARVDLPQTLEDAQRVLDRLDYVDAIAWRVEPDRILASSPDLGAFTVWFRFKKDEVVISKVAGWPVE